MLTLEVYLGTHHFLAQPQQSLIPIGRIPHNLCVASTRPFQALRDGTMSLTPTEFDRLTGLP